jgi:hypothetical protein
MIYIPNVMTQILSKTSSFTKPEGVLYFTNLVVMVRWTLTNLVVMVRWTLGS